MKNTHSGEITGFTVLDSKYIEQPGMRKSISQYKGRKYITKGRSATEDNNPSAVTYREK